MDEGARLLEDAPLMAFFSNPISHSVFQYANRFNDL